MRDILIKNLTSEDKHRRRLQILERVEQNGILATSQRYCAYLLREKKRFKNLEEINNWFTTHKKQTSTKIRYLKVVKARNTLTNQENLVYQVAGRSYLVVGHSIFCAFFTHIFKIQLSKNISNATN